MSQLFVRRAVTAVVTSDGVSYEPTRSASSRHATAHESFQLACSHAAILCMFLPI